MNEFNAPGIQSMRGQATAGDIRRSLVFLKDEVEALDIALRVRNAFGLIGVRFGGHALGIAVGDRNLLAGVGVGLVDQALAILAPVIVAVLKSLTGG